ncbi:MAG: DUF4923 family protein [Bacteroidaceae bacterium]|jgi:hypothetical protein|nr:DUF4923 family protein [Bacteroidaceae bacterium]
MKKNLLRTAFIALGIMVCSNANAQLENILKSVAGEAAANVVGNLLGTNKVSEKSLVGTWSYNQPCVAFESENVLATVGSSMVSTKVEKTMQNGLTKVGFTSGKVVMTLKEDKTGIIKYNGKAVDVNWAVDGTNLKLTFPLLNKGVTMNAKLSGSELQVAMKSDKLLTLLNAITEKAGTVNSSLGTLNTLTKNVKGMYMGLKFTKK